MKDENLIKQKVNETMDFLNNIPNPDENPFLVNKIFNRLSNPEKTKSKFNISVLKPALISLILILNILTVISILNADKDYSGKDELLNSLTSDYQITQTKYNIIME